MKLALLILKFISIFQKYFWNVKNTDLKQENNKKNFVNLYKDIVLVTRVCTFCRTLFTNNNIKIVIKSHTFLFHPGEKIIDRGTRSS